MLSHPPAQLARRYGAHARATHPVRVFQPAALAGRPLRQRRASMDMDNMQSKMAMRPSMRTERQICLDLMLHSSVSATFRVPIAVTGNCIRETKQQQASSTPAERTTPVGGFWAIALSGRASRL